MNQKKIMRLWQMIVLLILAITILITMFLPAYHIHSDALKKGLENAQIEEDYYKDDAARDKEIKKYTKKFNKEIKREEKENGTDNENISVLKLMTKSLADIRYNGKYDDKYTKLKMGRQIYDALNKRHRITRILLWIIYGLTLAAILNIILGYCLKLNKYIPLTNNIIYGIFAALIFGFLQFGTINGVKEETGKLIEKFIDLELNNINSEKIANSFLSYAFLMGMAAAIIFLIVSIVSMFVGNQAGEEYSDVLDSSDDWDNDWNEEWHPSSQDNIIPGTNGMGYSGDIQGVLPFDNEDKVQQEHLQQAIPANVHVEKTSKKLAVQNGSVRCSKGATSGASGYILPQDRKVIVGKSPHRANLVIINNSHISNVHCTIRYNAETNMYKIKDHSTNGTFVNGTRLPKDISIEYPAGTVLNLVDGSVEITLG